MAKPSVPTVSIPTIAPSEDVKLEPRAISSSLLQQLGISSTIVIKLPSTVNTTSSTTSEEPNINFTMGTTGGIMYLSGQPMSILKPFGYLGSESGSSIASYTLSKVMPYRSPAIKTFTRTVPGVIRGGASTAVLGRAVGRFVPVIGWGLLVWDVSSLMYTYRKEIKQGMNARQDYIDQGLMPIR